MVRQGFTAESMFDVAGFRLDGVNIWIMFKLVIIMPLTGLFAWWQTKAMQKYRLPEQRS